MERRFNGGENVLIKGRIRNGTPNYSGNISVYVIEGFSGTRKVTAKFADPSCVIKESEQRPPYGPSVGEEIKWNDIEPEGKFWRWSETHGWVRHKKNPWGQEFAGERLFRDINNGPPPVANSSAGWSCEECTKKKAHDLMDILGTQDPKIMATLMELCRQIDNDSE